MMMALSAVSLASNSTQPAPFGRRRAETFQGVFRRVFRGAAMADDPWKNHPLEGSLWDTLPAAGPGARLRQSDRTGSVEPDPPTSYADVFDLGGQQHVRKPPLTFDRGAPRDHRRALADCPGCAAPGVRLRASFTDVGAGLLIDRLHAELHLAAIVHAEHLHLDLLADGDDVADLATTRWGANSLIWTRPSRLPRKFTKAPKSMTFTTLPS